MRDQELIKIMEIKEKDMEKNLLQKAEAFGYLYKEYQKEIKVLILKRDEELEQSLGYKDKLWTDSIDQVNSNLIKIYQAQGEFEQSLNSIGQRKNELIKQHIQTQEWYLFDKGGSSSIGKNRNPKSLNSLPLMPTISLNLSILSPQNTKEEKK